MQASESMKSTDSPNPEWQLVNGRWEHARAENVKLEGKETDGRFVTTTEVVSLVKQRAAVFEIHAATSSDGTVAVVSQSEDRNGKSHHHLTRELQKARNGKHRKSTMSDRNFSSERVQEMRKKREIPTRPARPRATHSATSSNENDGPHYRRSSSGVKSRAALFEEEHSLVQSKVNRHPERKLHENSSSAKQEVLNAASKRPAPPPKPPASPDQTKQIPTRSPPTRNNASNAASTASLYKAKYPFIKRHPDELDFAIDDVLKQVEDRGGRKAEPGWIWGENLRTRKVGLVPVNYLEEFEGEYVPPSIEQTTVTQRQPLPPLPPSLPPSSISHQFQQWEAENPVVPTSDFGNNFNQPVTFRNNGYATDVIGIRSADRKKVFATKFNVRFTGKSAKSMYKNEAVDVIIDGNVRLTMAIGEGATAAFRNGSFQCDPEVLGGIPGLADSLGPHELRFEHRYLNNETGEYRLNQVFAKLWVWDSSDFVVVSDIDGTITRSDVGGMINGVIGARMGWKKGYAHPGVCFLYNKLIENTGSRIMYLTARPLSFINETRSYIEELEQPMSSTSMTMKRLPPGPIITDTTNIRSSFKREVVEKTSHIFKTDMLKLLRNCFGNAGRDLRKYPVFIATFGNKDTDSIAYKASGAPEVTVFIIGSDSKIQVADEYRVRWNSYCDPQLYKLIMERVELICSGRLPDPNFHLVD